MGQPFLGFAQRPGKNGHRAREYFAKNYDRYHLRNGNLYLHLSGLKLTEDRKQAWSGTVEQGRACRAQFDAAAGCILSLIELSP